MEDYYNSTKHQFQQLLANQIGKLKRRSIFSQEQLQNYITTIKTNQVKNTRSRKSPKVYYILNKYYLKVINGVERLLVKEKMTTPTITIPPASPPVIQEPSIMKPDYQYRDRYMVSTEEIFDVVYRAHVDCGHGGEKRTAYQLKRGRVVPHNVSLNQIKLFLSLCKSCLSKRSQRPKPVYKPIVSRTFGERGQVDLISVSDDHSSDKCKYKYILNYQDHLTKFCILKPLESKNSTLVTKWLVDIFTTFGCPSLLQSDNGREFTASSMEKELRKTWPHLRMVHGRPRHPQSQGSVERANGDVMQMLRCWLRDHRHEKSCEWVTGLPYVQYQKNIAYNRTIKCSPYKAVFGQDPPVNGSGSADDIDTEDEENVDDVEEVYDEDISAVVGDETDIGNNVGNVDQDGTSLLNDTFANNRGNDESIRLQQVIEDVGNVDDVEDVYDENIDTMVGDKMDIENVDREGNSLLNVTVAGVLDDEESNQLQHVTEDEGNVDDVDDIYDEDIDAFVGNEMDIGNNVENVDQDENSLLNVTLADVHSKENSKQLQQVSSSACPVNCNDDIYNYCEDDVDDDNNTFNIGMSIATSSTPQPLISSSVSPTSSSPSGQPSPLSLSFCRIRNTRQKVANDIKCMAQKMIKNRAAKAANVYAVGSAVTINIPNVDKRDKMSFNNVIGKINRYYPNIDKYEILTEFGILNNLLSQYEMKLCKNLAITFNNCDRRVSLRRVSLLTNHEGVGCKCSGKCYNNSCFCKLAKKYCNINVCQHKHQSLCLNNSDILVNRSNNRRKSNP